MKNQTALGEFLKNARTRKGYSQRKLSSITKISNSTISRIESGLSEQPDIDILRKLAVHLEVSYQDLMKYAGYISQDYHNNVITVDDENLQDILQVIKGKKVRITIEIIG